VIGKPELPHVSYEWQRTARVLAAEHLEVEHAPEGKRIAFIRIVRDDVFVPDEIWPLWLNWFHGRTRESVVKRELLFEQGAPYTDARIEETMRNLRSMGIFALVRIVAVQTGKPGEVGVLVHTRDLWSLRPETSFNFTRRHGSRPLAALNTGVLRLTEINLLGMNKAVSAELSMLPQSLTVGESYYARRVFGSTVSVEQSAGLIINRDSHHVEGNLWSLQFGQPLYYLKQRYGWTASYDHQSYVARATRYGEVRSYPDADVPYDGPRARLAYRRRSEEGYLIGQMRLGEQYKQTFSLGWDYRALRAAPNAETQLPDELRERFVRDILPKQRTENGPYFSYDIFMPIWATFTNLATYGQSENVRIGPHVLWSTRLPLKAFGSTTNSWVVSGDYGYTLAPRGALIDARAIHSFRYEHDQRVDQRTLLLLRGASPVFSIFRFVASLYVERRKRDTQNTYVTLGGDNGLRGYDSASLGTFGGSRALANFELRTLPLAWQAVHLGGVIFSDVGSVYRTVDQFHPYYCIGVGARLLFPQFNRYPFSFDAGMSFDPTFRVVPTITSGQVVPLTATEDAK
jgi:hypothetical protein